MVAERKGFEFQKITIAAGKGEVVRLSLWVKFLNTNAIGYILFIDI